MVEAAGGAAHLCAVNVAVPAAKCVQHRLFKLRFVAAPSAKARHWHGAAVPQGHGSAAKVHGMRRHTAARRNAHSATCVRRCAHSRLHNSRVHTATRKVGVPFGTQLHSAPHHGRTCVGGSAWAPTVHASSQAQPARVWHVWCAGGECYASLPVWRGCSRHWASGMVPVAGSASPRMASPDVLPWFVGGLPNAAHPHVAVHKFVWCVRCQMLLVCVSEAGGWGGGRGGTGRQTDRQTVASCSPLPPCSHLAPAGRAARGHARSLQVVHMKCRMG